MKSMGRSELIVKARETSGDDAGREAKFEYTGTYEGG
jgi:hypothetical protein